MKETLGNEPVVVGIDGSKAAVRAALWAADEAISHDTAADQVKAVVVGVDGSRAALNAVRWATAEAVNLDVPLRIVYAVPSGNQVSCADTVLLEAEAAATEARESVRPVLAKAPGDDRHRCSGAQGGQEQIIWRRPSICAAKGERLVCNEPVRACFHSLREL